MRSRPTIWILLCLLCLAGAWLLWPHAGRRATEQNSTAQQATSSTPGANASAVAATTAPQISATTNFPAASKTNQFAYRLSNTPKTIGELARDDRAILLANALIDTRRPLNFSFPTNLQSSGKPDTYIVQANGPLDAAFRARLAGAGAQIISYIPNNAYLVRVSADGAAALAANAAAVIPYEPYYKIISPSLLGVAVRQKDLPDGTALTLGLFADGAVETVAQIKKLGGTILAAEQSPFGPMVRVTPPANWTALADLPGVQIVEPFHVRVHANDLSRVTTGVAANSITTTNYLNLFGSNVMVAVPDSGIDASHPDLANRVFGSVTNDTDGHGTFLAGEIAGDGTKSTTVTNAEGSINPGTNFQYRGSAPLAKLFAMNLNDSDQNLQQAAALTNALISNNSWGFGGDNTYDLEAASYDAATRDALPSVTGSQPVLFVFSAGNDGNMDNGTGINGDDGGGGNPDTITSPATAKNVISVGAVEQQRNITNMVTALDGTSNEVWEPLTDTGYSPFGNSSSPQVAGYSNRGNVGIGTEGTFGRYKPDVVAPGTFVISTRSSQWDTNAYYHPTNSHPVTITDTVQSNSLTELPLQFFIFNNAVSVIIQATDAAGVDLPIYVWPGTDPNTTDPILEGTNSVSLPPTPANVNWSCAVSNTTGGAITYNLTASVLTTNDLGNYNQVLEDMNDSLGGFYRYESGTSMAAADVSGTLALIQDYFTNTLHTLPSPALLKALLINGARPTSTYSLQVQNAINFEGWGLINLPNSVPAPSTNAAGTNAVFFLDQSPTNALATGDSHTFQITISSNATALPFRVTVAWTDPPGNPAAAIKLVNNLDLIVSNMATNIVYYGNDIPANSIYNSQGNTNAPNLDTINNVENVFLPPLFAGTYSVTVVGREVNANAVSAQTNNVVQDFALVISSGGGLTPGSITVTDQGTVSNPTSDQLITDVVATNAPLFNQFAGGNSPLLGTNTIVAGTGTGFATNAIVTIGMTNQWHFYVVTNTLGYTNAAFITFLPDTLSIPRLGVFTGSDANSTTPEADIELYVAGSGNPSSDAALTNLDPNVISNCLHNANGDGSSLSRGGTEFVTYTNSQPNQIYYIGVKSETQVAAEYAFLPVFTQTPFSQLNPDGSQTVNGVPLPVAIPDGSSAHPGSGYVFGLALYPMDVQNVTVSNNITHQNIGDLIGTLGHNEVSDVLNNHDSSPNDSGDYNFIYDDSQNPISGSQPSPGPGSLNNFVGQEAIGPWMLTEADDSPGQTGAITGFSLNIIPHKDPTKGLQTQILAPGEFYTTYVDVPVGATNLTIYATNITSGFLVQPVELFVRYGTPPTTNSFDATTPVNPTGLISISATNSPPLRSGRYFIGLFNPGVNPPQTIQFFATIGIPLSGATPLDFVSTGPVPLLDDAVTTSTISVTNTDPISSVNVGIRVDHPRISDLWFHLISPDGTRYSLMQNRGAYTTNGAGLSYFTTNTTSVPHNGNADAFTNVIDTGTTSGNISITYNFYTAPDRMVVYYGNGTSLTPTNLMFDTGYTGNPHAPGWSSNNTAATYPVTLTLNYPPPGVASNSTAITIIMNPGGNANFPSTAWTYAVTSTTAKYSYLTFTEDTNLTTTPIKFAPTPFTPVPSTPTNIFFDGFEADAPTNYNTGQSLGVWNVTTNSVTVMNDTNAASGTNYLSLGTGAISTTLPTAIGQPYIFQYSYRGVDLTVVGGVQDSSLVASTNWQTKYIQFTASQNGTPVTIQGTGPGALLDNVTLTELPPTLYYQPEQSIGPLVGTSPAGPWTLEIQDNRVGAYDSNNPPVLQSWQMEFVLASTNALKPPVFTNLPGDITIDEQTTTNVNNGAMPGNTNLTLTYSLINPPADNWVTIDPNTGVITLTPQEVDGPTNWTVIVVATDNGSPSLSSSDSFNVTVNEVNTPPFWPVNVPSQTNYTILDLSTLMVTNTATDSDIPVNPLTYRLLAPPTPNNAVIDTNTGIITWTPTLAQQTNVYTFETIVTDTNFYALTNQTLSATNTFTVTVLPPLSLTNDVPNTNSVGAGSIVWYLVRVPTNADIATNLLLFADAPLNIWFSTNSPPTVTNLTDVDLIPNSTNGSSVLSVTSSPTNIVTGGLYYLGVQNTNSFAVTNFAVEVDFHIVIPGIPFSTTLPAKAVTGTNALLNGFATPSGLPATAWFEWGPTTNYGAMTAPVSVGGGFGVVYVTNFISSLDPAQTYHYRIVTSNNVQVVNGFDQMFAAGQVVAWGRGDFGQTNVPLALNNATAIAGGNFYSVALKNDFKMTDWGQDGFGHSNLVSGFSNVLAMSWGGSFGLGLTTNYTIFGWGPTNYSFVTSSIPASATNPIELSFGNGGTGMALKPDGSVVTWGTSVPGSLSVPAGVTNIVSIAAGPVSCIALRASGTVRVWGGGIPAAPAGLNNVVAIAAGGSHALALKLDGTVVAWGDNTFGQTNVPPGLTNVVAISASANNSMALKSDGTIVMWGDNTFNQTNVPADYTNIFAIASGGMHSLAIKSPSSNAPTNYAPFWPTNPPPQTVNELALLTVTNTATDTNSPPDALAYSVSISVSNSATLANGWPTNFVGTNPPPFINPTNGIITWTPSETQGPGVYTITTIVTDTNVFVQTNQSLSATNSFSVTVNETNSAPFWPANPPPQTVNELALLTVTNTATDTDVPTNTLTYFVSISVNTGAMIASNWPTIYASTIPAPGIDTNGVITWTPSELQGPGVYTITTIVTDTNLYALANQSLSATNSFSVTVNEVNTAPFFTNNLTTNTVAILTTLTVTNTALDNDIPANAITYRFLPSPPAGMSIDTNTGIITWTPGAAFAFTTTTVGVIATDFNPYALANKNLSATNFLVVIVLPPPYSATLAATAVTGTNAQMNGFATPNGLPAFAWFEWGTNSYYGNRTTNVSVGSGLNVVYVTNKLAGLLLPQPYHFRLVTSNSIAITYGFDQIFDVGGITVWGDTSSGLTNIPPVLTNTAVAISAGSFDSLALRNNGRPIAWGDNSSTQTNVPASLTNAVAVASGYTYNLALRNNGRVVGWGDNSFGQTNVPAGLSNVVAIAAGDFHGLALRTNGTIVAWGAVGLGSSITNVPASLSNVVAIAAGGLHSLALKNDGTVVAWGINASGQTNVPAGLKNVMAVAGGDNFSLALKTNGTVVAWGDNSVGETNVPIGLSNVVAIAAGRQHCLALKSDGTVVAWGDDTFFQTNVPPTLGNVAAIAGGGYHSLALVAATPVNQLNNRPPAFTLSNPPDQALNPLDTLIFTNTAADPDVPPQILTYSLLNPPANASINSSNGIITFAPTGAQAGLVTNITSIVTDNGTPNLSATNTFTVTVRVPVPVINGVPQTNSIPGNSLVWYQVNVPTNADFATNILHLASAPLNLWFSTNAPPTITNLADVELIANTTNGQSILGITTTPTNIVAGGTYYLGVQNTGGAAVTNYVLEVDFHLTASASISISSITATNIGGKFGYLLKWFAPTNDYFLVQWTPTLSPTSWSTFNGVVSYNTFISPTNSLFTYFDDGSQTGGFGPTRFYRLILLAAPTNTPPFFLTAPTNQFVAPLATVSVTNTASDYDSPAQTLVYSLLAPPANASINPGNGVITFTPASAQAGTTNVIQSVVTDNGSPNLSATNQFTVFIYPTPSVSSVSFATNALTLNWNAWTNEQFQVEWTTNLTPVINWTIFPGIITSTTGAFSFTDTNAPFLTKFYRLILLP